MKEVLYLIKHVAIGYIHLMAGPGHLITGGDGHHFTTVAGLMKQVGAGCGFQVTNGDQHGLAGAVVADIMDGLR